MKKRSATTNQPHKQRFSAHAELISNPVATSRIYRELDLQIHSKAVCLVGTGLNRDEYVVHFVREKVASDAMRLTIGDNIVIRDCTFNEYPPRSGNVEIHARTFRMA